jgi:HD-GYP domain-containing protein (c-di-GMP phosphodiesterase class II)
MNVHGSQLHISVTARLRYWQDGHARGICSGSDTEAEWEKMRQHPGFAYEMLSSIRYLQPALDIPYCHHEKWDGTGYPRGLKGSEIPIAARIFAVADVWDAITSNRPYRKAWSREEGLEYIREQAGKYFDPQVVDEFFRLISGQHRI